MLLFLYLCSPPEPHQDACSWILNESNKCSFALISALPSSGIRQIRIHWLLNAVTVHSRWVLKTSTAMRLSVNLSSVSSFNISRWSCYFYTGTENHLFFIRFWFELNLYPSKQRLVWISSVVVIGSGIFISMMLLTIL